MKKTREYKIGDWVIYINKEFSDSWKLDGSPSLYKKLAKIIDIDKNNIYLLEFKEYIDGFGFGKKGHCLSCGKRDIKLAINHYKFKKWIQK